MLPVTLASKVVQVVQGCPVPVIALSHCLEADRSWFSLLNMVGIHVCQDLGGRGRWYSSLPSVGKPLMVVVTVQGAPDI